MQAANGGGSVSLLAAPAPASGSSAGGGADIAAPTGTLSAFGAKSLALVSAAPGRRHHWEPALAGSV